MHRCLIDASRMCVVWIISICCNWESFKTQQILGYTFVLIGNIIYYEILKFDWLDTKNDKFSPVDPNEKQALYIEKNAECTDHEGKKTPALHLQFTQDFTEENKLLKKDKL
jgi:hypothetical protein